MKEKGTKEEVIFVASFRHPKTGRIIYARDYGLKAFRIRIRCPKPKTGK